MRFGAYKFERSADGEITIARDGIQLGEITQSADIQAGRRDLTRAIRFAHWYLRNTRRYAYMICEPRTAAYLTKHAGDCDLRRASADTPVWSNRHRIAGDSKCTLFGPVGTK